MTPPRRKIAVLASGTGSNLAALLERATATDFPGEVVLVISNRADAGALDVARAWNIPSSVLVTSTFGGDRNRRDRAILDALRSAAVDLVVCAGYNMILSDEVLRAYPDAILNVHPSLLPAFGGGMNAVDDALAHGVKVTGCTVHLLEPGDADGGAIVLQAAVAIDPTDDAESLHMRIHEQEWRLLPEAVALWCNGRLVRDGRHVRIGNGKAEMASA